MNIIASASHPLRGETLKLAVPDSIPPPAKSDSRELLKAASLAVGKHYSVGKLALKSWQLTTLPHQMPPDQLTGFLAQNNLPAPHASRIAEDLHPILNHPATRGILFGISGGSIVYLIVEKTSWPRRKVWTVTLASGLAISALYFVLRHFGYIV
jgi:hypothetical protein